MKLLSSLLRSTAVLLLAVTVSAQEKKEPAHHEVAIPKDYPLTTCVVADEKLGEMGKPVGYVHSEAGKPDRVIAFCCEHCIADFKTDPARYLKKLDDAVAAKTKDSAGQKAEAKGKKEEAPAHKH
jgi:hypothetical protein